MDSISINESAHTRLDIEAVLGSASATWIFNPDAAGITSLNVLNNLDLDDGSLEVDLAAYGGTGPLVLFDYGSLTGTFSSVSVLNGSGWTLDYNYLGGSQIALIQSVPEPSSIAFLGMASLAMIGFRRRR